MGDIPEHIAERVARAICACHEPPGDVESEWPNYHQSAVAAIEALGGERIGGLWRGGEWRGGERVGGLWQGGEQWVK